MKNETGFAEDRLLSLLPPIRRARFWRLYAQNGRRILDFWMDGGRDLLGAKGTGLGTTVKAAVDMGLSRPLPSVWKTRLAKQVSSLWPGYEAQRFYLNEDRALAALGSVLGEPGPDRGELLVDPARRSAKPKETAALLLRPFGEFLVSGSPETAAAPARLALLRLPCSRILAPSVLLFRDSGLAEALGEELLPPLMLAAASRSLWELSRFAKLYGEAQWSRADRRLGPYFDRRGPFLYPRYSAAAHEDVFRAALAAGALLSPVFELPSLLPGDFDDGELARLATALEAFRGV